MKTKIITILFFISFLSFNILYSQDKKTIDSLENLLYSIDNYIEKTEILNQLTALHFGNAPQKSLQYAKAVLTISEQNNYTKGKAAANLQMGRAYAMMGNYDKSFEVLLESKRFYQEINDVNMEASVLNALANVLYLNEKYREAMVYYKKALNIKIKTGDTIGIAIAFGNIGETFMELNQLDSAYNYNIKGLELEEYLQNENGAAISRSAIAYIKYLQGDYKTAIKEYQKAIAVFEKHDNYYELTYNYMDIAKVYFKLNKPKDAYKYIKEGYEYAISIDAADLQISYLELFSKYYQDKKIYGKALYYHKKYVELKDSIFNIEKDKQISEMQSIFELKNKQKEIELLNQKHEKSKIFNYAVSIILFLAVLLIIITLRQYFLKKKTANLLLQKNKEIEEHQQEIITQNEQLEIQTKQLKELDEIKSAFFANISHEFRTPLTLILGPVDNLIELIDKNDNEKYKLLNIIKKNAKKMLTLINQLLDLSKIEKGALKLSVTGIEPNTFFRTIFYSFSSLAEDKDIKMEYQFNYKEENVYFDADKLEIITCNLISNAIKYTEQGGHIKFKLEDFNDKMMISVEDTGKGIELKDQKNIFNRFYQAKNTDNAQGTGIGLSLVKELTELHKGEVKLVSKLHKGSIFSVIIPTNKKNYSNTDLKTSASETIYEYTQAKSKTEPIEKNGFVQHSHKLLIVEDNIDMQNYIKDNLKNKYEIKLAKNGIDGIEILKDFEPDLIISDVMMPKMDGFEFTRNVKSNNETSHIPIILLTAKSSENDKLHGLEYKADDYLTKPFNLKELKIRISNLIQIRKDLSAKFEKNIKITPSEITSCSADEKFLTQALKIVEDNIDDIGFTVEIFCEQIGMSRASLHRKLKALTNQSTSEFIRKIRLKRAAYLIKKEIGNVSEIAYQTGFNNLSYFSKCFKEEYGLTPSEYEDKKS